MATPNAPIITWAVAVIGSHLIKHGNVHDSLNIIALVAIVMWAVLEIFLGVNYFRRALGVLVLALALFVRFHN